MADIAYRTADVDGLTVFYREAGASDAPTLVLLHGFPSASHMFRELIPLLAGRFHLVAPDLPGFGNSDMPPAMNSTTRSSIFLTEVLGLDRFALYVFDYGAPIGFRIAVRHPERITAIISQNGNAYEEGLSDGWNPIQAYWKEPSQANRKAIHVMVAPQTTIWQYTHGVPDTTRVSPDGYGLDNYYLARNGADEVQLDQFLDYASNVAIYPVFQEYFRTSRPPLLAVWGSNDRSSCQPGPKPSNATYPMPTSVSCRPAPARSGSTSTALATCWSPTPGWPSARAARPHMTSPVTAR